jgi:hypothetical protein
VKYDDTVTGVAPPTCSELQAVAGLPSAEQREWNELMLLERAARTEERTVTTTLHQRVERLGPQRLTGLLERPWRAWLFDSLKSPPLDASFLKSVRSLDLSDLPTLQALLRKEPRLVTRTGRVRTLMLRCLLLTKATSCFLST